jgi:hypothetical protein
VGLGNAAVTVARCLEPYKDSLNELCEEAKTCASNVVSSCARWRQDVREAGVGARPGSCLGLGCGSLQISLALVHERRVLNQPPFARHQEFGEGAYQPFRMVMYLKYSFGCCNCLSIDVV